MKNYIVRVRGANGETRWVTVSAASQGDARARVSAAGSGWTALGVYDNIDDAQSSNPNLIDEINSSDLANYGTLPSVSGGSDGSGNTGNTGNTGNDGTQNAGDTGFKLGEGLEDIDVNAAYRRALQSQGLIGEGQASNPAERYLRSRIDPAISAFRASDAIRGIAPGENPIGDQTFEGFAGGNVGNYRQIAADSFRKLSDIAAQRLGQKGNVGIVDDPALQDLINPPDSDTAAIAFDAARNAFLNRFSSLVGNTLLRDDSAANSLSDFRASTNGGAGNYLEALRRRFGLRVAS